MSAYLQPVPDEELPFTELPYRTLVDVSDAPPGELLLGMLEPGGPNLMYALGGTGKGSTGAWMIGQLLELGLRTLIYDAENRPKEWARRVSGLGIDRRKVPYLQPKDLPRELLGKPLWDIAPFLGEVIADSEADVLLVDSIMPAVGLGEERLKSDAQVPYLWVAALDALEVTSVSFGHPPKGQPEGEPFGSVAWVNAMRLTWLGTKAESDGHGVRWRPKKRNERGHIPGVLLSFEYGDDNRLAAVTRSDDEESTRDWILKTLAPGPQSVADMADQLLAEVDNPTLGELDRIKQRLGKALHRMAKDGWVVRPATRGRTATWALRAS